MKIHAAKQAGGNDGVALGYRHGVLGAFVLVVYVFTAMPSVPGGDAGELLASGCQLGTPHPPAAVLVHLTIEEWTHSSAQAYNSGAASAAALLFSFSPLAWEYNTGSEVFALNNVLVAVALYITARIVTRPSLTSARIGAVALAEESLLSCRSLAELGGLWFPLGLSPHAALVVSSRNPQQGSWGDLSSTTGFLRHVLRSEYGTLNLGIPVPNAEGAVERIGEYLMDSSSQTMHVGPPMAALGIGWALAVAHTGACSNKHRPRSRRVRHFGLGLATAWAFYVTIWHCIFSNISLHHPMSRAVHARFWIQPNLLLCVAAGCGLGLVANTITANLWRVCPSGCGRGKRFARASVSLLMPTVIATTVFWLRWDSIYRGPWMGGSHGWTMHLYGQALLSALPQRALLLSHTDLDLNAARYLRVCEGLRTDVTHISLQMMPYPWWESTQADLHPGVVFPPILRGVSTKRESEGNAALVTRFLAANLPQERQIFLDMQAVDEREIGAVGFYRGFSLVPHGLVYRVLPRLTLQESERWHEGVVKQLRSLSECMQPVTVNRYHPGTWEFSAASVYWDAHYQAGLFFLSYAIGAWDNAPRATQRPHLLPALRDASALLQRTLEAADGHGMFSSSRSDLLKNTVLAKIRLLQALQAEAVSSPLSNKKSSSADSTSHMERRYAEIMLAREYCLTLIPRFLLEAIDDKDAEAFGKVYVKLRETSHA
ncbi:unnamed protein product [Ectocarpus fasciculatus]